MAAIPIGEIITEPHVGHRWPRWTTAGADLHRRRALERECVGWHRKRATASEPMGLAGLYSTAAGVLGGLGWITAVSSDHFTNQMFGIQPSYFVAEPQTNGVAERFNRTLRSRTSTAIAELRPVRDFVELYNAQWIVEKNGYLSESSAWHAAISIRPGVTLVSPGALHQHQIGSVQIATRIGSVSLDPAGSASGVATSLAVLCALPSSDTILARASRGPVRPIRSHRCAGRTSCSSRPPRPPLESVSVH